MKLLMRPAILLALVAVIVLPATADKAKDLFKQGQDAQAQAAQAGAEANREQVEQGDDGGIEDAARQVEGQGGDGDQRRDQEQPPGIARQCDERQGTRAGC